MQCINQKFGYQHPSKWGYRRDRFSGRVSGRTTRAGRDCFGQGGRDASVAGQVEEREATLSGKGLASAFCPDVPWTHTPRAQGTLAAGQLPLFYSAMPPPLEDDRPAKQTNGPFFLSRSGRTFCFLVPPVSATSRALLAWNSRLMAEEVNRPRFLGLFPPRPVRRQFSSLTYACGKKVSAVIVSWSPNLVSSPFLADLSPVSRVSLRGGSSRLFFGSCEKSAASVRLSPPSTPLAGWKLFARRGILLSEAPALFARPAAENARFLSFLLRENKAVSVTPPRQEPRMACAARSTSLVRFLSPL